MKLAVFVFAAASAKRVARQADDAVANETAEYDDYGERKRKRTNKRT